MPSWSSLAANQLVDRTALNDAVTTSVFILRPGQSVPTGTDCVSKDEARTWLYLIEGALPVGTELPVKSQLSPSDPVSFYSFVNVSASFGPANSACSFIVAGPYNNTVYAAVPTLVVGTAVYSNSALTTPVGERSFIVSGSSTYYYVPPANGGVITVIGTCG